MKVLVLSDSLDSLGLFYRMQEHEGHEILAWVKSKESVDGDGIIEKTKNWMPKALSWAELVISDSNNCDKEAEMVMKVRPDLPVFCGSSETASWEDDRVNGMKEIESWGLQVPEWFGPFNLNQAREFIKKTPGRYVFKPSDSSTEKEVTYCAHEEDSSDMLEEFDSWEKQKLGVKSGILQTFIEGEEIAIGGFFSKGQLIEPCFINFEYKRTHNGNRGVNSGETGTIGIWSSEGEIVEMFRKVKLPDHYSSYFDLNCIANEDGIFVLEPTVRLGYPTCYLQWDSIDMEIGEFFLAIAEGSIDEIPLKEKFCCAVVACLEGFPFIDAFQAHSAGKKLPSPEEFDDIWLYEAVKEGDQFMTPSCGCGVPFVFSGIGSSIEEAKDEAYKDIHELDKKFFFRDDIGQDLIDEKMDKLIDLGIMEAIDV